MLPDLPIDGLVRQAVAAEAAGVDSIWVADEKFYRDPFITLGAIATYTSEVRIGTCVVEPYSRHPALISMAMGSLAELAPGRVVIGIGAGGSGFPPMGVQRKKPATAMSEASAIIRGLLCGEEVTVEGNAIRFEAGRLNFATTPIPIYIAGRGPKMLKAAGRTGDGVIAAPYASPLALDEPLRMIKEGIKERSDEIAPSIVARVDVAISSDRGAARQAARYAVALPIWSSYPNLGYLDCAKVELPDEIHRLMATHRYDAISAAAEQLPLELVNHFAIAGDYEEVRERVRAIAALVDELTVFPIPTPDCTKQDVVTTLAKIRDELLRSDCGTETKSDRERRQLEDK
jgi:5,10-methylenetetrahydromethanopterin reductase